MNKRRPINHGTALILLSLFKGKKYDWLCKYMSPIL